MIAQPVAGYVFVLDGVLMGAGDAPYLAKVGVLNAAVTLPFAAAVYYSGWSGPLALASLWIACTLIFMIARAITLGWRVRGDARSEEHTSELQSRGHLVCRLLLEKYNTHLIDPL